MSETSKTTDNALRVLLALGEEGSASAAELSRALGINRTAVSRLLTTLHRRGFVLRQRDGSYSLGPTLSSLGQLVFPALRARARPAMEVLSRAAGETVVLWLLDGENAMAADQVVGDANLVRVQFPVGSRSSLELASSGRVLLAHQKEAFVDRIVEQANDPARLRRLIAEIRAVGYGVSHDELQRGVHGAAAPIFGHGDHAIACLAMIVPTARASLVDRHIGALLEAAAAITADLRGPERNGDAASRVLSATN